MMKRVNTAYCAPAKRFRGAGSCLASIGPGEAQSVAVLDGIGSINLTAGKITGASHLEACFQ